MNIAVYTCIGAALGCLLGIILGGWLFKSQYRTLTTSRIRARRHRDIEKKLAYIAKKHFRRRFRRLPYAREIEARSPHIGSRFYF